MKVKRQYAAIDIAKYVSALLVVCIHVFPFYELNPTFNTFWMQTVCRIAVPFFFTVSGFFFFRKIEEGNAENMEHLKKFVWRILKIYFVWTLIYLPYTIYDHYKAGFSILLFLSYIRDFFMAGSYYHLWFLPALAVGTCIVYTLYKKKGLIFTLKSCLILYVVGYLINIYAPIWESIPGINFLYAFFEKIFVTARNGIFFGPMFISLGLLLSKTKRLPKKVSALGFAGSFLCVVLEVSIYYFLGILQDLSCMFVTLIPTVYFLVNWLLAIRLPYKPIYRSMREDSLIIYTSHILFAKIFLNILPEAHLVAYFLTIACAQGLASLIDYYRKKFPVLEKVF